MYTDHSWLWWYMYIIQLLYCSFITWRGHKMDSCVKNQNKTSCESEVHENCSLGKEMTPDLVVRVRGRDFCCNKKQMMGSSEFFRGMFESEMKEANSDCVQIEEADIETMAAVIRFCETGRLELSVDNVHQVAELASKYQVWYHGYACKTKYSFWGFYLKKNGKDLIGIIIFVIYLQCFFVMRFNRGERTIYLLKSIYKCD